MAGYEDTKQKIVSTLMGRPAGEEIQPENHQDYALNMLEYIRSVELASNSSLIGWADETTVPVQPDNSNVFYISGIGPNQTIVFSNFIGQNGQELRISASEEESFLISLLWNGQYWSYSTVPTLTIAQKSVVLTTTDSLVQRETSKTVSFTGATQAQLIDAITNNYPIILKGTNGQGYSETAIVTSILKTTGSLYWLSGRVLDTDFAVNNTAGFALQLVLPGTGGISGRLWLDNFDYNVGRPTDEPKKSGSLFSQVNWLKTKNRIYDDNKVVTAQIGESVRDVFVITGDYEPPKAGDIVVSVGSDGVKSYGVITEVDGDIEKTGSKIVFRFGGYENIFYFTEENGIEAISKKAIGKSYKSSVIDNIQVGTETFKTFTIDGYYVSPNVGDLIVDDLYKPVGTIIGYQLSGTTEITTLYYKDEIIYITAQAISNGRVTTINKAKIGSSIDAPNFNGSLYSKINAIDSQFIVLDDIPYGSSLSEELLKIPMEIRRKGMRLKYKQVPYNKYVEGVYIDEDVSDDKWKGSGWVFNSISGKNKAAESPIGICTRSASANDMESISVGYGAISNDQNSASFGNRVTARGLCSFSQGRSSFGTYFGDVVTFPTNDSIDFGDFDLQDLKIGDYMQIGIDDIGMALPVIRKIKSISGSIVTFTEEIPKEIRDYGEVYVDVNNGSVGHCSFTANDDTNALNLAETAFGRCNKSEGEEGSDVFWKGNSKCTLFSIGNGTSYSDRKNAFEVKQDGTIFIQKPGTSDSFNLQGTIGETTDIAKEDGSLYARIRYLMEKKNYKRYNRNLLDKLTTQSTPEEITAAFTPIGESAYRKPKEGDIFIEGDGQWLGSGRDFIVTFCSEYWADWTMVCGGSQKEITVNFTEYDGTRKISAYKTRDIGWTEELVKNKGTNYVRAVNDVLLRKLYEACDAVYNADDDTYTLNEVKLTKDEMFDIYVNQNMWNVRENIISWCDYPHKPKTNIPPHQPLSSGALGCRCVFVAYVNDSLETFKLSQKAADTNEQGWLITFFDFAFQGCKNLRKIIGVIQFGSIVKLSQNKLMALPALEDVRFKFAQDAWIKDSPKLSYDSVKFMAEKSTNGSKAITISLHADVFAKLSGTASDDAYTQSGHTKEEWMAIVTTAQGRNVSFAEAV